MVSTNAPATNDEEARRVSIIRPPAFAVGATLAHVGRLVEYWDLLMTLSAHRVKVRYKQSTLGFAWAILQPLSLVAIYTVIFSIVTKMDSQGMPYSAFALSALIPWLFFSNALTSAANSLVGHNQLITKVYFPREIIPLTYVIASFFDLLIGVVVLGGVMLFYGIPLTLQIVYIVPIIAIAIVFTVALSLALSATQVRFRDIGLAMPLVLQIWMFASPVVYALQAVPARMRSIYILNPLVGVVENFRRVVLQGVPPDRDSLITAAVVSTIFLPVSYAYFKQREATMADII